MSETFALNMDAGDPIATVDNGDGTCTLTVVALDAAEYEPANRLGTFALKKDRGLPLKTVDNGDGTVSLLVSLLSIGNVYWIKDGQSFTIGEQRENLVTGPMFINGTLVVQGRNTVIG